MIGWPMCMLLLEGKEEKTGTLFVNLQFLWLRLRAPKGHQRWMDLGCTPCDNNKVLAGENRDFCSREP